MLVDDGKSGFGKNDALNAYKGDDTQIIVDTDNNTVTDKGIYDWDHDFKPVVGNEQIEAGKTDYYYTNTPKNVHVNVFSLEANTTYIKDVVNGALALELVVDGKYLNETSAEIKAGKTYVFEAKRYYDDPIDPLPYDSTPTGKMNADTSATGEVGKKYQITFTVDKNTLPENPKEDQLYTVWATLTNVEVEDGSDYVTIKGNVKPDNPYTGYTCEDALPIGTYVIDTTNNSLKYPKFKIGTDAESNDVYFEYLKNDIATASYTYDKFPENVYNVSKTAPDSTGDGEYLVKNGARDNSPKNIAESSREKTGAASGETQILTFYFGTVESREIDGKMMINTKGENWIDNPEDDYAKDRLGIILLSVDPNRLAISKMVTNTKDSNNLNHEWQFTITFKPETTDLADFVAKNNADGFGLMWYKLDEGGNWKLDGSGSHASTVVKFGEDHDSDGKYSATLSLKHNEKVVISGLPEGTWQVIEQDETEKIFYSAHNNMDEFDDYVFSNKTSENIELNPNSHVDFVNEFPYELPSAGGHGINFTIYCGIMLVVASGIWLILLYRKARSRDKPERRCT